MEEGRNIYKILLCGSINSQFGKLVTRVKSINEKHGPFEAILTAGCSFRSNGEECDLKSYAQLGIPLLILSPEQDEQMSYYGCVDMIAGGEISPNIIYLGSSGVFKLASGISVAYLSKRKDSNGSWSVSDEDCEKLCSLVKKDLNFTGVDFLLTPLWPQGVLKYANVPDNHSEMAGAGCLRISNLAALLNPRYHLAYHTTSKSFFYERLPYKNYSFASPKDEKHVTRFINLADVGQSDKWLYAIKLTPLTNMPKADLLLKTQDTTESPYISFILSERSKTPENFTSHRPGNLLKRPHTDDYNGAVKRKKVGGPPPLTEDCWFCLSNPNVEKHMVIKVGEHNYVVLAKGGIVSTHCIICPIGHFHSLPSLESNVYDELIKFKQVITKMFHDQGKTVVLFDRNYHTQHLQIQMIPIPKIDPKILQSAFIKYGSYHQMKFAVLSEDQDLLSLVSVNTPYIYIEFENVRMLHVVRDKIPIQFVRETLVCKEILNLPQRMSNWKECILSKQEESQLTEEFAKKLDSYQLMEAVQP